jgi:hypothetical protein
VIAGPRRHTIAGGETFASIARLYYGSERYAETLRQLNRGRFGRGGPQPGDLLVIPPREELDTSGPSAAQDGPWAVPDLSASVAAAGNRSPQPHRDRRPSVGDDRDAGGNHPTETQAAIRPAQPRSLVHPGETPRSIAQERLGDARRANEIIQLNYEQLAKEGRWRPGLRIRLPADADAVSQER